MCNNPIQGGYSIQDIKSRIAILAAIENKKKDEDILIENAEATYLQNALNAMRWGFVHKDLITFSEDVTSMKEYALSTKKPESKSIK